MANWKVFPIGKGSKGERGGGGGKGPDPISCTNFIIIHDVS